MAIIGNIKDLLADAASVYISQNSEDFRSIQPGPIGATGPEGPRGISLHHIKGTSTTNSLGDFGVQGSKDTYTLYGDAHETLNLGHFVVANGYGMDINVYDSNEDGIVNNSDRVGGKTLTTIETEYTNAIQIATSGLGSNFVVSTYADINSLLLNTGDKVFVLDDGDGHWAQYLFDGISVIKFMDEDTYLNANTKEAIKATYESNPDTNAFTDAYKSDVDSNTLVRHSHLNKVLLDSIDQELSTVSDVDFNTVTSVVDITDMIRFNMTANAIVATGELAWNTDETTLDLGLGTATLQIGQEFVVKVRNGTGSTISNGRVCMATGTIGNSGRIVVGLHDGTQLNAKNIVGITTQSIAPGADGFVTMFGKVRGVDTSMYTTPILYVKPNDNGTLTNTEPTDSELKMSVAYVVSQHTNGTIFVRVTGLDENHFKPWVLSKILELQTVVEW